MNLFLLVVGILLAFVSCGASEKVLVCYYGTWATYRNGLGKFDVDHIDASLCTHVIYSFVGINNQGTVISLDPYLDLPDTWGRNNFGKFNSLKQRNPNLKTILAVGGWNEGSGKYSIMAANPTLRQNFVTSALNMVLTHGFDGFDLDWEYPNRRDTVHGSADVNNFTQLLKELREAFDQHGLLLTAAVAAVRDSAAVSYDIPGISKYLDFINIMTYDMYGAWDAVTGHNAPLHKGEGDGNALAENLYTVDYALKYWIDQGCPVEKIVLGLPLYGRTFTLSDSNVNSVRAPASGAGIAGPFSVTDGMIGYNELCSILQTGSWDVRYDNLAKVPYAVQGRNWVSFDNADSLVEKLDYGLKYNIAGVMVWSIETDDFHGVCHGETFPLLKALNRAIARYRASTTTTTPVTTTTTTPATTTTTTPAATTTTTPATTTTTTPATTTTTTPAATTTTTPAATTTTTPAITTQSPDETTRPSSVCQMPGFARNPEDCSSFYLCVALGTGDFQENKFMCPATLYWDHSESICNYPIFVNCNV